MRMSDYEEVNWAAGRPYLSMDAWAGRRWRQGLYRSDRGIVEVYQQMGLISLRFRWAGRDYCRTWRTTWGDRTIARLARELVEDVTS